MGVTESKGFGAPFSAGAAAVLGGPQCAGGFCTTEDFEEVVAFQRVHLQSVLQSVPTTLTKACGNCKVSLEFGPIEVESPTMAPPQGGASLAKGGDAELRQATLLLEGVEGAFTFLSIGMKRQQSGDLDGALDAFREALQIRSFMIQSGGDPKKLRSQELHSALFLIKEALEISECTGTQVTAESVLLGGLYGILCHIRGDLDHAAEAYPKALQVLESLCEARCLQRAVLLHCMGDVRSEMGMHEDALVCYQEAHQLRLAQRALQTYQGALLMMSIGLTRLALDDPSKALEAYTLAALVFDSLAGTKTNTFAVLLTYIGTAKLRLGEISEALASLGEAHNIRQALGTLERTEGRHLAAQLARARRQQQNEHEISVPPMVTAGTESRGLYVKQVDPVEAITEGAGEQQ